MTTIGTECRNRLRYRLPVFLGLAIVFSASSLIAEERLILKSGFEWGTSIVRSKSHPQKHAISGRGHEFFRISSCAQTDDNANVVDILPQYTAGL